MNLQSEIDFFADLRLLDKARLLNLFLHEFASDVRAACGPGAGQVVDGACLRLSNELCHRLTGVIEQLLAGDAAHPPGDVVLRTLLSPREDRLADQLVRGAWLRAVQGFERFGTTILMK